LTEEASLFPGLPSALDAPALLSSAAADIRLFGQVNDDMLKSFLTQLEAVRGRAGPLVLELSTTGGDADVGRRIALDVKLLRESRPDRVCFLGKSVVYSAGVSVMSGFTPADRYLTRDAVLLIHERRMEKTVHFSGALRASQALAHDLLAEIENGQRLEKEGFEELVRGTALELDVLMAHVRRANWYVPADEALRLGLVAALV